MSSLSARIRPLLPVLAVLLISLGIGVIVKINGNQAADRSVAEPVPQAIRTGGPPNILVVMTDDQTLEAVRVLDNVDRLITKQGTTFANNFASFPSCCPSRATYLTGQFAHNDNVRDNVPPLGGNGNLRHDETLPVWLQRAGYYTASVGKYLNGWGADGNIAAPPGWNHWFGLIDPTTYNYYGYSVSDNGTRRDFGHEPEDYQTDVLGAEVVRVVKDRATDGRPWFLSWTPLAPHAQEGEGPVGANDTVIERLERTLPVPADRHKGKMRREQLPRTPSFNQKDVSGLPSFFQKKFPITFQAQELIRQGYQQELEALLAVDEWVSRIVTMLMRTEQMQNTVIMFTSDNGYFHGEHRITFSKVYLYEPGVRVPLMIRGGPFARNATVDAVVGNVDLAPTILGLAGAKAGNLTLDGRDLAPVARNPESGKGRGMLLENWTSSGAEFTYGIRTERYKYLNNRIGEEELYDLQKDPDEIENLTSLPSTAALRVELRRRAEALRTCAGATCEGADAAP